MPRSPAHDVAVWLEDNIFGAFGADSGWCISVGTEPASPDQCITTYDTGGGMSSASQQLYDPTIQIRVRDYSYTSGYTKASDIRDALAVQNNDVVIGDWHYTGFFVFTDVAMIGKDDNDRCIFTFNLRLMREPNS